MPPPPFSPLLNSIQPSLQSFSLRFLLSQTLSWPVQPQTGVACGIRGHTLEREQRRKPTGASRASDTLLRAFPLSTGTQPPHGEHPRTGVAQPPPPSLMPQANDESGGCTAGRTDQQSQSLPPLRICGVQISADPTAVWTPKGPRLLFLFIPPLLGLARIVVQWTTAIQIWREAEMRRLSPKRKAGNPEEIPAGGKWWWSFTLILLFLIGLADTPRPNRSLSPWNLPKTRPKRFVCILLPSELTAEKWSARVCHITPGDGEIEDTALTEAQDGGDDGIMGGSDTQIARKEGNFGLAIAWVKGEDGGASAPCTTMARGTRNAHTIDVWPRDGPGNTGTSGTRRRE